MGLCYLTVLGEWHWPVLLKERPFCLSYDFYVCMVVCVSQVLVSQSCLTLCDPTDCSPTGSSVHGIFQARILEWGAIAFSEPTLLFLPPSDAYVRSFLYLLDTLIKLYYTEALSDQASSLAPD